MNKKINSTNKNISLKQIFAINILNQMAIYLISENKTSNIIAITLGTIAIIFSYYIFTNLNIKDERIDIMMIIIFLALFIATPNIINLLNLNNKNNVNQKIINDMIKQSKITMFYISGIITPIIEELTFREWIPSIIKKEKFKDIVPSIIFILLHRPNNIGALISYSLMTISFVYIKNKNGIKSSILLHILWNIYVVSII